MLDLERLADNIAAAVAEGLAHKSEPAGVVAALVSEAGNSGAAPLGFPNRPHWEVAEAEPGGVELGEVEPGEAGKSR